MEGLYYPCSENKGADQLRGKLICVFVFAYAKSRFSRDEAQLSFKYISHILTQDDLKNGRVGIVAREKFNHMATTITTIIYYSCY